MADTNDTPDSLDALANARRYCPACGHANRLMARICVNCGQALPPIQPDAHGITAGVSTDSSHTSAVPVSKAVSSRPGPVVRRAKRCPDCGAVCKLDAKVCPNCGHHFQTDFSKPAAPLSPTGALPALSTLPKAAPVVPPVIGEAPIVQMPNTGVSAAPEKAPPVALPPAARSITPPAPVVNPAPPPATDTTEGEPAPEVTDVDLTALRRAEDRASGRTNRNHFFKKDNS